MSPDDKDIKFPDSHYVGFQGRPTVDNVPLGFMTPDGTDAAAVKRKATVDNWTRGRSHTAKSDLPPTSYENKPMSGFKLGREIRHSSGGWGQGNVKWRIEDPRGFELEISSPNLAHIIAATTLENGEILEQCMWARLRSENILVPVTTDVYKAAQANTERSKKTASIKDVKLGDRVILQNGTEGVYLGQYTAIYGGSGYNFSGIKADDRKRFYLKTKKANPKDTNDYTRKGAYQISAALKIAEIIPVKVPLTETEAEQIVLNDLPDCNFYGGGNNYVSDPLLVSTASKKEIEQDLVVELDPIDVTGLPTTAGKTLVVEYNGQFGTTTNFDPTTPRYHNELRVYLYDKSAYDSEDKWKPIEAAYSGYYRNQGMEHKSFTVSASTIPQLTLSRIRIKGVTKLGNTLEAFA